jgi:hypothetical protein
LPWPVGGGPDPRRAILSDRPAEEEVNILFSRLLALLKKEGKKEKAEALTRTEESFQTGKNAEAVRRARAGGTVGGSALAEDSNVALLQMLQAHQAELARELNEIKKQ